jgi:hypothetical protein
MTNRTGRTRRFWAVAMVTVLTICLAGTATAVVQQTGPGSAGGTGSAATDEETLVLFRHGEKPASGLGQLDCQGLNRALKLPTRLSKFGKPEVIFAPDPTQEINDGTSNEPKFYYYVRPFATVEPTAIQLGMPVNMKFGYKDIAGLETELLDKKYSNDTIFIVWEHKKLHEMVVDLVEKGGLPNSTVPNWPGSEFDRIDLLKITHEGQAVKVKYEKQSEGLNRLPTGCP